MKEIELALSKNEDRPVTRLFGRVTLIDTGALIPVFSFTEEFLRTRFKGKLLSSKQSFSGFGNHKVFGDVYSLSNFYIKELHFKTLEAFIPYETDTNFPILLSAPLFCHTEYTFMPQKRKMIIKVPDLLVMNNEFNILSLKNNEIRVQLNGVLMQNNSFPNILMQNDIIQQMENYIQTQNYKSKDIRNVSLDGLHKAFERYDENGDCGICGDWKVEHDLSSSTSLWKLSFAENPIVICETRPKHDYIIRLNKSISDKIFTNICEIAKSVFPICQMNPSEKRRIQQNQSQGR